MQIDQWKIVPALVASVMVLGGCTHTRADRMPKAPVMVLADSPVHEAGTCRTDARRGPRNFVVTIHVGPPGTPLLKEGSKVIAPGETPVFRVERNRDTPPGNIRIKFVGQEDAKGNPILDARGRAVVETPFVGANGNKVTEIEVAEMDEHRERQPGEPWTAHGLRARTMCDGVCTFERPCKYSITYETEEGEYPELDPYTIIH